MADTTAQCPPARRRQQAARLVGVIGVFRRVLVVDFVQRADIAVRDFLMTAEDLIADRLAVDGMEQGA